MLDIDTEILTPGRWRKIRYIETDEIICGVKFSCHTNRYISKTTFKGKEELGRHPCLEIDFEITPRCMHTILCSGKQLVKVAKHGFITASRLLPGDSVLGIDLFGKLEFGRVWRVRRANDIHRLVNVITEPKMALIANGLVVFNMYDGEGCNG